MNLRNHALAWACLGLFAGLAALFSPSTDPVSTDWISNEMAEFEAELLKVDPTSARAEKLHTKIARLEAYRSGRPQPGFPDEYARFLTEMKTPSDRLAPEYEAGYQLRELEAAQILGRKVSLPWVSRGPGNVAGRARGILVDSEDVTGSTWFIASVGGGVWKTEDAGITWRALTDDVPTLQVQSIASSPANPSVIYVGTGESFFNVDTLNGNGILKSVDKGETWTLLPSTTGDPRLNNVSRIVVSPTDEDLVLASATVGAYKTAIESTSNIFRSTDGGVSWTVVHTENNANSFGGPRILQLVADPTDFDVLYATVYGAGILKSTDAGLTWNYINTGITDFTGRFEMAISPVNPDYLFASAMGQFHSELWVSLDGGANWFETFADTEEQNWLGGQGWYDNTIVCHPTDPNIVYVGGLQLWRITMAGLGSSTRSTVPIGTYGNPHPDHHGLEIVSPQGGNWYLVNTNDGGMARTVNGVSTASLSEPDLGMVTSQYYGVDKSPGASAYIGGMQDNGTWRSPVDPDANSAWIDQIGGDGYETSWHFDDPLKLIGGFQFNGLNRSLDGGLTWSGATNGLADTGSGSAPFITKIGKSIARPDQIFAVGVQGVWRSDDFGGNWSLTPIDVADWGAISSFHNVKVSKADPDIVWAGSRMDIDGNVMVSTDAALSFSATAQYAGATLGRISGLATHPAEPNTAYALFSFAQRPKVLKTTDLGATWTDISGFAGGTSSSNGFPDVAVYDLLVFPHDTNRIWVGTEIGLVESLDGGATWALSDSGLPSVGIWWLNVIEDEAVIATHGRGIWTVTDPAFEDGSTFNPLLGSVVQAPDGTLRIELNLRSEYDSSEVLVDGMGVVATFGPNIRRQEEVVTVPVLTAGLKTVTVRSVKDGDIYESVSRSVDAIQLGTPVFAYASTVDDDSELLLDGLTVTTAAGFSTTALQTAHNYPNGLNGSALITVPIRVGVNSTLSYDEIAIIEPGEPGSVFGDGDFWDYAIVEGTVDGVNWLPLVAGYDARADNVWLNAYYSASAGTPAMLRNRVIDLTDTFAVGDTILVRFRFFADGFVVAWGWLVDNIVVDPGTSTDVELPRRLALAQNVPNPFNPQTAISFSLPQRGEVSLKVFDVRGRLVNTLVQEEREAGAHSVVWDGKDAAGVQAASGVYLYRLVAGEQTLQQKMTLVK